MTFAYAGNVLTYYIKDKELKFPINCMIIIIKKKNKKNIMPRVAQSTKQAGLNVHKTNKFETCIKTNLSIWFW